MLRIRGTSMIERIRSAMSVGLICASSLFAASVGSASAEEACQACLNDEVRALLQARGDDGRAPRHVIHFAYPNTQGAKSRRAVTRFLEGQGFTVTSIRDRGVAFEHESPVARGPFDKLTEGLSATLVNAGWYYDGWEAQLIEAGK